jgi:hypothetical protein
MGQQCHICEWRLALVGGDGVWAPNRGILGGVDRRLIDASYASRLETRE